MRKNSLGNLSLLCSLGLLLLASWACTVEDAQLGSDADTTAVELAADETDAAYEAADSSAEKVAILTGFLRKHPESDDTGPFLGRAVNLYLEDLEQPDEAYALVEELLGRVEDPEVVWEVQQKVAVLHARTGHLEELRSLVATMAAEHEFTFTNYYELMELAEEVEAWDLVIEQAEASLVTANAEAMKAQYDDVTDEQAEIWAPRRKAFAASFKGWAQANIGQLEQAEATFSAALPYTTYSLLGTDETPLHYQWARTLMLAGNPEGALDKLGPMAVFGEDREQKAYREAWIASRGSNAGLEEKLWSLRGEHAQLLPAFTLSDYEGGTWSTRDRAGGVLLIAAWHPT